MNPEPQQAPSDEDPPPILGSWQRLYALVVIELLLCAGLLYLLARWAA
ncbi:MAG TPA: hypothetical protein VFG30_18310 [Polyangiales bacterium]|nr:hypothetical protein [Polyangiales bacterium]